VIGAERLAGLVKRHQSVHRVARRARFILGCVLPPRRLDGIPGRIHRNDFMLSNASPAEIASYAERAQNVIALIEETLEAAGRTFADVGRWLDFGCGYGRVIRFLVELVPPERIVASDVIEQGAEFCRSEFGVACLPSRSALETVELGRFDFIYAISVITHLNEENSVAFLRLLGESLAPGGIALFTTHGRWAVEHPELYGLEYKARSQEIAAAVQARGIAYLRYPFVPDDYGMTWHSRAFIETIMERLHEGRVAPVLFKPRGLDGHQDVFAFQRIATSA
jgi:SAM-dependent methyltransferase